MLPGALIFGDGALIGDGVLINSNFYSIIMCKLLTVVYFIAISLSSVSAALVHIYGLSENSVNNLLFLKGTS